MQVAKFLANEWKPKHELPSEVQKVISDYCGTRADRFAKKTIEYNRKGRMFAARRKAYEAAQTPQAATSKPQNPGAGSAKRKRRGKKRKANSGGKKAKRTDPDLNLDGQKNAIPEGREIVQY